MVLAYLIVSASFSSVASRSFNNLENYKERETKTIGRPPSVCVLILKSEYQSLGFTDEIQMNIFIKKTFDWKFFNKNLNEMLTESCAVFFRLLRAVKLII